MSEEKKRLEHERNRLTTSMINWKKDIDASISKMGMMIFNRSKAQPDVFVDLPEYNSLKEVYKELNDLSKEMEYRSENLRDVKDFFEVERVNLQVRTQILRNWPKKAWIERLIWVSTAIFAAGGASFAFVRETMSYQPWVAITFWAVGICFLTIALSYLKKEDDKKWRFYRQEFELATDLSEREELPEQNSSRDGTRISVTFAAYIALLTTGLSLVINGISNESGNYLSMVFSGILILGFSVFISSKYLLTKETQKKPRKWFRRGS